MYRWDDLYYGSKRGLYEAMKSVLYDALMNSSSTWKDVRNAACLVVLTHDDRPTDIEEVITLVDRVVNLKTTPSPFVFWTSLFSRRKRRD